MIPEPGDLDDISAWMEYLAEEHGVLFSTKGKRVRQLMLDQQSCDPHSIAYFSPVSLEGAQYLARHHL